MKICMDDIVLEVSNYYGYSRNKIIERTSQRNAVLLRQVCVYIARQMTNLSLSEIKDYFSYGDHKSVTHCIDRIDTLKAREADKWTKTTSTISYDLLVIQSKLSGLYAEIEEESIVEKN